MVVVVVVVRLSVYIAWHLEQKDSTLYITSFLYCSSSSSFFFALKKINTYVCVCVCVFVLEQRNEKLIDNVDDALDDDENAVVVIVADDDDDDVFVVVECMSGSVE